MRVWLPDGVTAAEAFAALSDEMEDIDDEVAYTLTNIRVPEEYRGLVKVHYRIMRGFIGLALREARELAETEGDASLTRH